MPLAMTGMKTKREWIWVACLVVACGDDASSTGTSGDEPTTATTEVAGTTDGPTTADGSSDGLGSSGSAGLDSTGTTAGLCVLEPPAIVTDIDETLTLSDGEFLMQIGDGTYDPIEREGSAELITAYAELGYHIMYLSARSETIVLEVTGETAREATDRWLLEHGFPVDPATTLVVLSPSFVVGDSAQAYKAEALMEQQALGWRFDYAYGNATSDIGAYAEAEIALDATFIIGEHAGVGGTVAVAGEGWLEHSASHLPTVPTACEDE